MKSRLLLFFPAIFIFMLMNSCAVNPVTGKRDFMLLSKKQEITMGRQADPEIVSFFGLYDDARLQQFIQDRGQKMVKISHRSDLNYEFKIVDSPVVNAFAVPGGYVYFTRGIMAHFNNEAEFAGVLGHEIGHIAARHSAKQYSRSMLAQVGLAVGMVLSPTFRQFGDIAQAGISVLFLKFGRNHERQSDKLGVEYSSKIGYDAQEMSGFFLTLDRLQSQSEGGSVPTFLSTHPDPKNRLDRVAKLADKWQEKLNLTDPEVDRNAYLEMIDGMIYGEDPKQGYIENNVFYHPVMKFRFPIPNGWAVQNTPQQVQMAPKSGEAMMVMTLASENSLRAAAQSVLEKYQLQPVESEESNVNGLPAIVMVADQQQQGQAIRVLSYLIEYGGAIYQFLGVSTRADFNNYFPVLNNTMQQFRRLTDPDKINVQPARIRVKSVKEKGTLSQALRRYGVDNSSIQELAILNGMEPDTPVEPGMLIKVVEK